MRKLLIGICDADSVVRDKTENICNNMLEPSSIEHEIIQFEDSEFLLSDDRDLDILILDIEIPGKRGTSVKQYLRDVALGTLVIFVANDAGLVFSAFGLQVFGFVLKSRLEEQLNDIFASALQAVISYVLLEEGIDSRDILYICSEHIYSRFVMREGKDRFVRISLHELECMLSKQGFIRIHRSYLVNAKWIESICDKVIMVNGIQIPVSSRRKGEVKEKYRRYRGENTEH